MLLISPAPIQEGFTAVNPSISQNSLQRILLIWKLIFAFVISLFIVLIVYFSVKKFVPAAELVSALLFLFVYAFIVRRFTL